MGRWCYRPCKMIHENGEEIWDIRSFYYGGDGSPVGWSAEASCPCGETLEELKSDIEKMLSGVETKDPLILHVYVCKECNEKDAHFDKTKELCNECLAKQSN